MALAYHIEAGLVKMFRRILLILAVSFIAGLVFLLGTTPGLKVALKLADYFSGNQVAIAAKSVEGRLLGDFVLHHAQLGTPALNVEMNRTKLQWSPGKLLYGEISIEQLILADGKITLAANETDDSPSENGIGWLPDVSLEALKISSVQVTSENNTYLIDSISAKAALQSGLLALSDAQLHMPGLTANMAGTVNLPQSSIADLQLQWDWQSADLLLPVRGTATLNGDAEKLNLAASLDSPTRSLVTAEIDQALTTPSWQAEFSMAQINLQQSISAEMPDVDLLLQGHSNGNRDSASIDARGSITFDGVERPWEIDASLPLIDDSYPKLAMSSGQALLELTPEKERKDKAAFKLNIPDLAELWPGLSGQIKGDGVLHGSRIRPTVNLSMHGSQLTAGEQLSLIHI